jgi:DNA-binding NarL/FixJ family response regulator
MRPGRKSATVRRVRTRYLLVDDSDEFAASATRLLESQGSEVVGRATTGAEALELVQALDPDAVLLDIELGEEDGIALTHDLHERAPHVPIVLISAYGSDDLGDLISGSRAAGFVPKHALAVAAINAVLEGA